MATPEIHIHTHVHLDKDVLSPAPFVTRKSEIEEAGQISFDTPAAEIVAWETELANKHEPEATASAVAITPQSPHDQRKEIRGTSKRNDHLMNVDEKLSEANSFDALAIQIRAGRKQARRSASSYENEAKGLRTQASTELLDACGNCALVGCQIRGNFKRWERMHESADKALTRDQEPRSKWRKRLVQNSEAGCVPPKQPKPKAHKD